MDVNHTPPRQLHNDGHLRWPAFARLCWPRSGTARPTIERTTREKPLSTQSPPPRIAEAALLEVARTAPAVRIVCTSNGRGQAARSLWRERPSAQVSLCYLDQFQQRLAIADHNAECRELGLNNERLTIACASNLPDAEFELALIPCSVRGEAELQRDYLQQAYVRLVAGGRLISSVDNPRDRWLHEQMQAFETKVSAVRTAAAAVYTVIKGKPLRRLRSYECEFTFRDHSQTITAVSRPGVFSHRHLDSGSKALLDAVTVKHGERIIDIGCGSGVITLALAKREAGLHCLAIDSNARAIECTKLGAIKNDLTNVVSLLTCDGANDHPASYDIAICNPPYYSNFRIAKLFIDTARTSLRPGGRIYIVTKQPDWYQDNLYPGWRDMVIESSKQYSIVQAIRG